MDLFPALWGISIAATIIALGGVFIVKKTTNQLHLRRHHGLIDSTLGVVGTLFSILLGLLVAGALERYQQITAEVSNEARCLAEIYHLAEGLPEETKEKLQSGCVDYCNLILDKEWPAMEHGHLLDEGMHKFLAIGNTAISFKPKDNAETNIHAAIIESGKGLGEGRRNRAESVKSQIRSTAITIFVCSFIILALTCLYVTRGIFVHTLMTACIATCLAFNIGLLYLLSSPFKGELKIQPTGFVLDKGIFEKMEKMKHNRGLRID